MMTSRKVFVTGLKVEAAIGIHAHEEGRTQPLIIDAVIDLSLHDIKGLKDTLNYELVGKMVRDRVAQGHIRLVETLAEDVASALLDLPHVQKVELSIAKPEALSDADRAGVTVIYAH